MLTEAEPANSFVLLSKLNCSLGSGGTFTRSKVTGREDDYTPPSSAVVKDDRSYTSDSPIRLHGVHKSNFTFTFYRLD
jgi:hypothetical protein